MLEENRNQDSMDHKLLVIFSCLMFHIAFLNVLAEAQSDRSSQDLTKHLEWDPALIQDVKNDGRLVVSRSSPEASDEQWDTWIQNVSQLDWYLNVKELFIYQCRISEKDMEYLCSFPNIETVTLGHSIEGVLISPKAMPHLSKLKKLTELSLSIQGISDAHFETVSKLEKLRYLFIDYAAKNMISSLDLKFWKRGSVSDVALSHISKCDSLQVVEYWYPVEPDEGGETSFTIESLELLFTMKSLRVAVFNKIELSRSNDLGSFTINVLPSLRRGTDF